MVSAPQNPIQLARPGTTFAVRIGDKDGNAPTDQDEFLEVIPIVIELGTGGSNLDRATFQVDLGATGQNIVDWQVDPKMNRQVEVYAIDENGDFVPLFWGEFEQQNLELVKEGQYVVITASVSKHHFGKPLAGPEEYHKGEDENQIIDKDLVFNPELDNRIYGNQRTDPNDSEKYLFTDPYSAWTDTAKTFIGTTPELWTLETAVKTLIRLANESEEFIENPDSFTILNPAPDLKNFTIRRGTYLCDALDQLLDPHGFTWYLRLFLDAGGVLYKEITFIRQGSGVQKNVYFQRPGETLDITKSNVPEFTIETNLTELANRITVFGDFIRREMTKELKKGWPVTQDALTPDELQKKDESVSQFEEYPNAHRKWPLNEGGDYNGLRPEIGNAPTDLFIIDDSTREIHKRRKAEKLLSRDKEGNQRDPYLEYYDNSLTAWKPVPPEWGYRVLDDEIGIYFTGNKPPAELWEQGMTSIDNMRLRLTFTVVSDHRIQYTAERQESSPIGHDVELFIDASDRFFDKAVEISSPFYGDEEIVADEIDSTTEIQKYAEDLRKFNDSASIQAHLGVFGIVNSYQRGDLIAKVDGRNISLNRNSSGVATKKFPQVTGIQHDYENQQTTLITTSFNKKDIIDGRA
ncbi:MAG: hypothetical protein KDA77_00035 [Planctomycetaceae bacterium]|nr:hypothetical protein [Planctomycetaceae bacterium]